MAISNPRQRNSEASVVRRQKVIRQTASGQFPLRQTEAPESRAAIISSINASPASNTGKINKFTAKSPLVTTMGSQPKSSK